MDANGEKKKRKKKLAVIIALATAIVRANDLVSMTVTR